MGKVLVARKLVIVVPIYTSGTVPPPLMEVFLFECVVVMAQM